MRGELASRNTYPESVEFLLEAVHVDEMLQPILIQHLIGQNRLNPIAPFSEGWSEARTWAYEFSFIDCLHIGR